MGLGGADGRRSQRQHGEWRFIFIFCFARSVLSGVSATECVYKVVDELSRLLSVCLFILIAEVCVWLVVLGARAFFFSVAVLNLNCVMLCGWVRF